VESIAPPSAKLPCTREATGPFPDERTKRCSFTSATFRGLVNLKIALIPSSHEQHFIPLPPLYCGQKANMGSVSPERSAVPKGIYCPIITFFTNDSLQDLDLNAQAEHTKYLIEAGVHGITILGTTGEAPLLLNGERNVITQTVVLVRNQLNARTTIVVGCSAQSVRETVSLCQDAKQNGAEYALILPPSYWAAASTPTLIENFYTLVCLAKKI
jgi:hypothetical protein